MRVPLTSTSAASMSVLPFRGDSSSLARGYVLARAHVGAEGPVEPEARPWLGRLNRPASVAQWKSSSVLRKRLGVRVPPGAPTFFAPDQVFLLGQTTQILIFARFLPAFCELRGQ